MSQRRLRETIERQHSSSVGGTAEDLIFLDYGQVSMSPPLGKYAIMINYANLQPKEDSPIKVSRTSPSSFPDVNTLSCISLPQPSRPQTSRRRINIWFRSNICNMIRGIFYQIRSWTRLIGQCLRNPDGIPQVQAQICTQNSYDSQYKMTGTQIIYLD